MLVGWGVFGVVVVAIFLLGLGNGTIILDAATFMTLLAAAPGAFIAVVSLNDKLGSKNRGYTVAGVLCVALFALGFMMRGPVETPSHDALEETSQTEENDSVVDEDYDYGFDPESVLGDQEQPISDSAPSGGGPRRVPRYEDERWPTTAPELTSVPDDQRWYNARSHMGTTCTVVGPVVDVYQAVDEAGAPVFVDIGEAYPSSGNVTLVIWAQDIDPFLDMLNAVDDGGAWLSVTGYLNNYEGMPQFNSAMSDIHFRWWTDVS